jgi:hypothetical protein
MFLSQLFGPRGVYKMQFIRVNEIFIDETVVDYHLFICGRDVKLFLDAMKRQIL